MKYDALDIEQAVQSVFDAFCEQFGVEGRQAKQKLLADIAATAREMKGKM